MTVLVSSHIPSVNQYIAYFPIQEQNAFNFTIQGNVTCFSTWRQNKDLHRRGKKSDLICSFISSAPSCILRSLSSFPLQTDALQMWWDCNFQNFHQAKYSHNPSRRHCITTTRFEFCCLNIGNDSLVEMEAKQDKSMFF